jgi:membrane-bound lytic murein transglycosylase D
MGNHIHRQARAAAVAALLWLALAGGAAAEHFPQYEVLRPNVDFWVDVYSRYSTTQAVVHDSLDLRIVYEVIDLLPYDAPGAPKVNRQRMQKAQARAEEVLGRLTADPQCAAADCRRVARLFGPKASAAAFRRARNQVRSQLGQKDRFRAGLIRSGAYLDEIRQILASYDLPADLAYLPHVESSFNPEAYSKFGAAGLWQFMPSTGKIYMEVGYVLDERRDPIRATHAAARLLKANHARLGSWPLAITAYNHGASGMERAKRQHGDFPAIFTSYRGPTFKFASRNFYAEFLAARQVATNYRTHFGDLPLDRPVPTRMVELEGFARFEDLCAHFAIPSEVLKAMNPSLRAPVLTNQKYVPKGFRLRLPENLGGGAALAAIPASLYQSAQKPSRFYTVQKGDTAGGIARTHGVRLGDLVLANNLGSRATIYPRQTLRIPVPGETLTAAVSQPIAEAATPPLVLASAGGPAGPTAAPAAEAGAPQAAPSAPEAPAPAAVSSGEVAPEGDIPAAEEIPAAVAVAETVPAPPPGPTPSGLPPAPEEVPAVAGLPAPAAPEAPPVVVAAVETAPGGEPAAPAVPSPEIVAIDVGFTRVSQDTKPPVGELQVDVEETLGHYAEWAGVRTQRIRDLNGLAFRRAIGLGQKVSIPLEKTGAQAFEESRYEYHKRLQEDFFAVYRVVGTEAYRVQAGDNVWSLCRDKFDVPLWLLKHYNAGVDLASLDLDQVLTIPLVGKTDAGDPGTVSEDLPNGEGPEAGEEPPA